jgi:hypothetical protein
MSARCLYWYLRCTGTHAVTVKQAADESGVAQSSIYMAIKMNPGLLELRGSSVVAPGLEEVRPRIPQQLEQPPDDPHDP